VLLTHDGIVVGLLLGGGAEALFVVVLLLIVRIRLLLDAIL
jgi:hypothetical protein